MKILLLCDDLMSRVRIESAWKKAGAEMLKKDGAQPPDLIVLDLTAREALAQIERLCARHERIHAEALRRARELGWLAELGEDD